jgi:hypothetical protein
LLQASPSAFLSPALIHSAEKVVTQHAKRVLVDSDVLLLELFAEEIINDAASAPASLHIVTVERFWIRFLQQLIEPAPIIVRKADEPAARIHPWRAGEIGVGALLAEVLFPCSSLLASHRFVDRGCEVYQSFPLLTHFAKHTINFHHSIRLSPVPQPASRSLGTGVAAFAGEVPVVESRAKAVAAVANGLARMLVLKDSGLSSLGRHGRGPFSGELHLASPLGNGGLEFVARASKGQSCGGILKKPAIVGPAACARRPVRTPAGPIQEIVGNDVRSFKLTAF